MAGGPASTLASFLQGYKLDKLVIDYILADVSPRADQALRRLVVAALASEHERARSVTKRGTTGRVRGCTARLPYRLPPSAPAYASPHTPGRGVGRSSCPRY